MKSKIISRILSAGAILPLLTASASAGVILIDFNTTAAGATAVGGTWNIFATPAAVNGGGLLDSTGAPSGLTLGRSGTITDSGMEGATNVFNNNAAGAGLAGSPTWVTSTTDNGASGDYFFSATNTGPSSAPVQESFTYTFGGLTVGNTFNLDLLAARNDGSASGFYDYSLDGGTTWSGFTVLNPDGSLATTAGWDTNNTKTQALNNQSQGYTLHRYMNVSGVTLTGTTLQIRATDGIPFDGMGVATGVTYSVLNAVRLTVIPEPSALGLSLIGSAALLTRRKRA